MRIEEKLKRKILRLQYLLRLAEDEKRHWRVLKLSVSISHAQMELEGKTPEKEKSKVKASPQRSAEYFDMLSERGFRSDKTRLHRVTRGQADRNYYGYSE